MSESSVQTAVAVLSVEQELERARLRVLGRESDAVQVAGALQQRITELIARCELLSALAGIDGYEVDKDRLMRVTVAVAALRSQAEEDPQVAIDVAIGLLVTDRAGEATKLLLNTWGGRLTRAEMAQLVPWTGFVIGRGKSSGRSLIRAAVDALARGGNYLRSGHGAPAEAPPQSGHVRTREAIEPPHTPYGGRARLAALEVEEQLGRIRALVDLGSLPEALEALQALEQTPGLAGHPEAVLLRADVLQGLGRPADALAVLEHAPAGTLKRADVAARRVRLLTELHRTDDALRAGAEALRTFRADPGLKLAYARALLQANRAEEALDQTAAMDGEPEVQTLRAEALALLGRADEGVAILEQVVAADPQDADRRASLAKVLLQAHRGDEALQHLLQALEANPARADLEVELARALLEGGQPFEALAALDRAQALGARGHEPAALRGATYVNLQRYDEASDWYARALKRAGDDKDAAREYARLLEGLAEQLLQEEKFDAGLVVLDAPLRAGLLTAEGMVLRAEMLRLVQRWTDALQQVDEAVKCGPPSVRLLGTQAGVLHDLGRSREALDVLDEALAAEPAYLFGRSVQVAALDEVGAVMDALAILDEHFASVDAPAWMVWAQQARGQLLADMGRFDDAVASLSTALEEAEENELRAALGAVLNRLGRPEEAVEQLREVVAGFVGDIKEWVLLELADGLVRVAGGMVPEARRVYRRIVTIPLLEPTPRQLAHRAWATFRLPARKEMPHPREEALELYRRAFEQATDPMFDDRYRALAVLQAGREVGAPAPEVDELFDMTAKVQDRSRALGIVRSAEYACDLLLNDSAEGIDRDSVDGLRRRLVTTLEKMEGESA